MSDRKLIPPTRCRPGKGRFSVLFTVLGLYIVLSTFLRVALLVLSLRELEPGWTEMFRVFATGLAFDTAVGLGFLLWYVVYLLLFPKKWIGTWADKLLTLSYLSLILFLIFFSLLAEIPFWDEFGVRFNFIAVDYLIYTYEVISNINQSYPLPLIISILIVLVVFTLLLLRKTRVLKNTFSDRMPFSIRAGYALPVLVLAFLLLKFISNKQADFSGNLVLNELGKNGVFSFFAAYRANELDYDIFYPKIDDKDAYSILKKDLLQDNQVFVSAQQEDITRVTKGKNEKRPNIILIAIESFSADFLKSFGNKDNLTPNFDSLAGQSIFFTNMYATGTRTVRGMEALTLSVPPTPGNSIVRRPNNKGLFSIATLFRKNNYHLSFIYGGDGYFDNMNNFFGGQGFDIVDRDRGNPLSDNIYTHRYNIPAGAVSFENAWGVCDEDLYKQAINYADKDYYGNAPFFQFIMTTSNHKPYTFPKGKIDLPEGTRNAAVKYTDYALGKFITEARKKLWFRNTVFVVVADHCASSAGKWEINIDNHHIPAIIYNLPHQPQIINKLASQIDLMPTLFGYLSWNYNTHFYGMDINKIKTGEERAFIGNYRTLGMLKQGLFTQIDDRKQVKQFVVSKDAHSMAKLNKTNRQLISETISYYQTASERFKAGRMKEN